MKLKFKTALIILGVIGGFILIVSPPTEAYKIIEDKKKRSDRISENVKEGIKQEDTERKPGMEIISKNQSEEKKPPMLIEKDKPEGQETRGLWRFLKLFRENETIIGVLAIVVIVIIIIARSVKKKRKRSHSRRENSSRDQPLAYYMQREREAVHEISSGIWVKIRGLFKRDKDKESEEEILRRTIQAFLSDMKIEIEEIIKGTFQKTLHDMRSEIREKVVQKNNVTLMSADRPSFPLQTTSQEDIFDKLLVMLVKIDEMGTKIDVLGNGLKTLDIEQDKTRKILLSLWELREVDIKQQEADIKQQSEFLREKKGILERFGISLQLTEEVQIEKLQPPKMPLNEQSLIEWWNKNGSKGFSVCKRSLEETFGDVLVEQVSLPGRKPEDWFLIAVSAKSETVYYILPPKSANWAESDYGRWFSKTGSTYLGAMITSLVSPAQGRKAGEQWVPSKQGVVKVG